MRIEVRAAEGGEDAKLFAEQLASSYERYLLAKG